MVHGGFWLLPLHLKDEQGTSFTQDHFISVRTAIMMLYMWVKFPRHTLAAYNNLERQW